MKDYARIKALASEILECIGDEAEGGDGTSVKHSKDERGGPEPVKLNPNDKTDCSGKKSATVALMASMLKRGAK